MQKEKANSVYHYCSLDSFLKIVQNKSIRLSDIEKSNDYAERIYMENKIHEELVKNITKDFSLEQRKHILLFEEKCRELTHETVILYAMCFSEEKDLLSQWRGYADDGYGVSIGFAKDILERVNRDRYGLSFKKVCYDEKEQEDFVKKQVKNVFSTMKIKNRYASFAEIYENQLGNIGCMKSPDFSEEREWRLCIAMTPEIRRDCEGIFGDFTLSRVHEHCSRKQIITYFDLSFEKIYDELITEIVIGPKAKVSKKDIYRSLYINGFNPEKIKISSAKVTYR